MKPASKTIAIVASAIIVLACLIYALTLVLPGGFAVNRSVDENGSAKLELMDRLDIKATVCGVTVTADPEASEVKARMYGSYSGVVTDGDVKLTVQRSGNTVTVSAGRDRTWFFGWTSSMRLDVVIPASFTGDLAITSSSGSVNINADLSVQSLYAHSSAGPVKARDVKASGSVELSSSAGSVTAGAIEASDANLHSSAGPIDVRTCKATSIKLQSSAGGVSAGGLSGKVEASSSAGPVDVTMIDVTADADVSSSAGRVRVALPANAEADIEAWTSAGHVTISGLDSLARTTDKRERVEGKLNGGGSRIRAHSSAGPVEIKGE